jgi:hypothetical protein
MKGSWRLTKADKAELVAAYQAGIATSQLASKYGIRDTGVVKLLRQRGIARRPQGRPRTHALDEEAFNALSPEALYWRGFLTADSYLSMRGSKVFLRLVLSGVDLRHLESFKAFVQSDAPIITMPNPSAHPNPHGLCSLMVCSGRMAKSLLAQGFSTRKSQRLAAASFQESPDFWRGVVDGDGHVASYRNRARLQLTGWRPLLEQFLAYVKHICPECSVNICPDKTVFRVDLFGRHALTMVRTLYTDPVVALPRKLAMAQHIMEEAAHRPYRRYTRRRT